MSSPLESRVGLSPDQSAINSPNLIVYPGPMRPHFTLPTHTPGSQLPVRVACHRGDWRNYVENTLEAVESCINMGADIIEVDVWRTKDGHLILMHDETLDRCSSGTGLIADHTLEDIRALRLKDGLGNMTEFTIPTVEEVLQLCKGRIWVNLDKADVYLDQVYEILVQTGTLHQTIVKSEGSFKQMCAKWGDLMDKVIFMPIINVTKNTTLAELTEVFAPRHDIYEVNFEVEDKEALAYLKEMAAETSSVLWINTIWPTTCGGHSDDHALKNRDRNWGYVVNEIGAGILQTDRPAMMIDYLRGKGAHP